MKQVPLYENENLALVDDEDYKRVSAHKWYAVRHQGTWYAVTTFGQKRSPTYMHRFVMNLTFGDGGLDHKDRNGLNNQKSNLRFANHSQQQGNRAKMPHTSSRYKGVSWSKKRNIWIVTIQRYGKSSYLGSFINEEDAARCYDAAALEHYGEFAYLNYLEGGDAHDSDRT